MSRVSTRNTCPSRFRRNAAHCCEEESRQFFWGGATASLIFVSGISLTAAFLASLGGLSGCFRAWGRPAVFQQGADGVYQRGAARAQLADTVARYLFEQFFTARKKSHQYAPAVVPAAAPAHVAMYLQPVDQLHGAVMLQRQPVRQRTNRRFLALGESAKRQQEQILLRLEFGGARRRVSFADEFANAVAQFRQSAIL